MTDPFRSGQIIEIPCADGEGYILVFSDSDKAKRIADGKCEVIEIEGMRRMSAKMRRHFFGK